MIIQESVKFLAKRDFLKFLQEKFLFEFFVTKLIMWSMRTAFPPKYRDYT